MLNTYSGALAPGTYLNREKQARCYITFAVLYNVPYLSPTVVHICMFYQYLANKLTSVSSVKNYISGARTWVLEHGGNPHAFAGYEQSMMIKALTKDSKHVVKRAFPLNLTHIYVIVSYLDSARNAPLCIKPCILIGYSCYLRSSNLLSPTFVFGGGYHTLLTKHVLDSGNSLHVTIVSTKTRSLPYVVVVPSLPGSELCPVRAWRAYVTRVNPPLNAPAFMINHGSPLSSSLVVRIMRDALSGFPDIELSAITMHSLRRGAVQQADSEGAELSQIMNRGGWSSKSGIKPYLSK